MEMFWQLNDHFYLCRVNFHSMAIQGLFDFVPARRKNDTAVFGPIEWVGTNPQDIVPWQPRERVVTDLG